jgi:hypothetical protein
MTTTLRVERVGVCAPGLGNWLHARAVLSGAAAFDDTAIADLAPTMLPSTERRRANSTTRWALHAAADAVQGLSPERVAATPTVFASSDGDGEVLATVLRDLAQSEVRVSPTTFHNSVYNAPAGYWSIAAHAPAPSTTLCTGSATFAAALLEAAMEIAETAAPVLLVAYDNPYPASSPIATISRAPFACALLLAPALGHAPALARIAMDVAPGVERDTAQWPRFAGNAAAAALPLLRAVACGQSAGVSLPYLDDTHLALTCSPCD